VKNKYKRKTLQRVGRVFLTLYKLECTTYCPWHTYVDLLYVRVTVHRNKFIFNNQPDTLIIQICSVIKLYMFRASSLPIIRSFLLYNRHWKVSCRFDDRLQAESGWNCSYILTLLGGGHQTCMKLTSAECTVENS